MKRVDRSSDKYIAKYLDVPIANARLINDVSRWAGPDFKIYFNNPQMFPQTAKWEKSLYRSPSYADLKMEIFNELMDGHGVEGDEKIEYVNTGDTYNPTIVRYKGTFYLTDIGAFYE